MSGAGFLRCGGFVSFAVAFTYCPQTSYMIFGENEQSLSPLKNQDEGGRMVLLSCTLSSLARSGVSSTVAA